MSWFILHTEAQREHVAAVNAAALDFGVLVPMYTIYKRKGGKLLPNRNVPLFPRYIMVEFDLEADRARYPALSRIRGAAAVNSGSHMALLCRPGSRSADFAGIPAPIPEKALQVILDREKARRDAEAGIKLTNPYHPGDQVVIEAGPFTSFAAEIERTSGLDRVVALMNLFGREVRTELNVADLRAVS